MSQAAPVPSVHDYRALREDWRALHLEGWCVLELTGPDTRAFLQGLATQDLAGVTSPDAAMTLFLTEKGRPLALAWASVASDGASAIVIADESARSTLPAHFERFRIMEEVEFKGPEGMPRPIGIAGPRRAKQLAALAARVPGGVGVRAEPLSFLLVPPGAPSDALPEPAHPDAAEAWRLASGLPRGGTDFDAERLATELSLPDAISLSKGCYVGQEVVARTSHRGQVRRHRIGFRFPWNGVMFAPRTAIHADGAPVGFVTSAAPEPGTNLGLGMGYLSADALLNRVQIVAIQDSMGTPLTVGGWPL
jgi:folate-binding protein YgfZ